MTTITTAARILRNGVVLLAVAMSTAAIAAAPAPPVPLVAPPPAPKSKPYQPVVQNDVTGAYQYRTRILAGQPGCQRFAVEADNVFIDDKLDSATKVSQLLKIEAAAKANACLAP